MHTRITRFAPLCLILAAGPLLAADPTPAARAQAILNSGLERIVQISADETDGVWALTDSGHLYHCRRTGDDKEPRVACVGREGPVAGGY